MFGSAEDRKPASNTGGDHRVLSGAYGDLFVLHKVRLVANIVPFTPFILEVLRKKQKLESDMKANGIYSGVTVSASFEAKFNKFVSESTTRTDFRQTISGIQNPSPPEPNDIVSYAIKFPSIPQDAPAVHQLRGDRGMNMCGD